jgi:hypothetical protein
VQKYDANNTNDQEFTVSLLKNNPKLYNIYNRIACDWLKENPNKFSNWIKSPMLESVKTIKIGGIFPFKGTGHHYYEHIMKGIQMAKDFVASNSSLLPNYKLGMFEQDGKCQAHHVMKSFINYYNRNEEIIGVLGPGIFFDNLCRK